MTTDIASPTLFADLTIGLTARMPRLRGRMLANQPMAPLTWFRVGGVAQVLFTPSDEDDLAYFLANLPEDIAVTVVGVGSNLIVRDGGIAGVVIRLSPKGFGGIDYAGKGHLQVGTAVLDKKLAEAALTHGVGGLEFYFGIPGCIGGALRMNAGANGGETKDVLVYATGVNRDGEFVTLSLEEMAFTYRHCAVDPSVIFTSALFKGTLENADVIKARMDDVQRHRETAQPIREKTGGSTFKNPEGHSAWKLVDAAGCRGLKVGGAQVSEMHCNFLINTGDATAADIENLGEEVRRRVKDNSGVELQWEIKRIGQVAGSD
jgi:UDP-N-acetylmuramate dehydrogenase